MVSKGGGMTRQNIIDAQGYLTMRKNECTRRILDIHSLMRNHSQSEIIQFMKEYLREKEKSLKEMVLTDKSNHRVDEIVAAMFRLHMAIRILEDRYSVYGISEKNIKSNEKEVAGIVKFKQGTEKSGKLHRRDSGSDSLSRIREDQNDDGKDQSSGDETRCIA